MPITDKTLGEAAGNGDGTYNGAKAIRWIYEAVTNKPLSEEEAQQIIKEAQAKAAAKKAARNV